MQLHKKKILSLILILLAMPMLASAATLTQYDFYNEYQADAIYLFIINDNTGQDISFVNDPVVFDGATTGWTTTVFNPEALVMQGSAIDPYTGNFDVTFWDNRGGNGNPNGFFDFTLEWAEYLGGTAMAQGSIYYTNGSITGADGNFTSTIPTPIPASLWLAISGLTLLVGIRRYH